jgi:hypothetical protein
VAKHPNSRECLILLAEILETPKLAERLLQVLRPNGRESRLSRANGRES